MTSYDSNDTNLNYNQPTSHTYNILNIPVVFPFDAYPTQIDMMSKVSYENILFLV